MSGQLIQVTTTMRDGFGKILASRVFGDLISRWRFCERLTGKDGLAFLPPCLLGIIVTSNVGTVSVELLDICLCWIGE